MSLYNCHKQSPQPYMSYIAQNMICDTGKCCPPLVTDIYSLPPFQIISNGDYSYAEISPHGEETWTTITIPITTVISEGFYIHSYDGSTLDEILDCGSYDLRVQAGEMWWFVPVLVEDFEFTENAYTIRDVLMLPFKFSEQQFETLPLIAPCDEYLPFMFSSEYPSSGLVQVFLYDVVNECAVEELTDFVVTILTISGKTYYIFEGGCIYPFLECGIYKLEIVDGEHSYFSVPFAVECDISDIPDGSRPLLDFNRCVMRDEDGNILYEECVEIPE